MQAANRYNSDPLTSYLWDSISHGVHYCRLSLNRPALNNFVKGIWQRIPVRTRNKIHEELVSQGPQDLAWLIADWQVGSLSDITDFLRKVIEQMQLRSYTPELLSYLSPVLDWMVFINDDPSISGAVQALKKIGSVSQAEARRELSLAFGIPDALHQMFRKCGLFDCDVSLPSCQDAMHISSEEHREIFIVEVASVKEEGSNRFLKFLSDVPEIDKGLRKIIKEIQHSSRIVFRPYPAAVSAWTAGALAAERLPRYLLQYLKAATRYYNAKEWRTSIVLSAIALETLLAEMFEDEFHRQADDIPLGALKDKIVESFKLQNRGSAFPNEVLEWIDKTNDARIAAVHRGSIQLSGREALDALRGLVKVAFWHYLRDQLG